mgnify:CR=1 FL=1
MNAVPYDPLYDEDDEETEPTVEVQDEPEETPVAEKPKVKLKLKTPPADPPAAPTIADVLARKKALIAKKKAKAKAIGERAAARDARDAKEIAARAKIAKRRKAVDADEDDAPKSRTRAIMPEPAPKRQKRGAKVVAKPVKRAPAVEVEAPVKAKAKKVPKRNICLATGKKCGGRYFRRGGIARWNSMLAQIAAGTLKKSALNEHEPNATRRMGPWKPTKAGGERPTHNYTAIRPEEG